MKGKICPFSFLGEEGPSFCYREGCMLFNEKEGDCAINLLLRQLKELDMHVEMLIPILRAMG
jgi:hypothetical protein